ncbi:MAG TPA: amino acid ABC transporter permease [Jatrophihabitantaceae bacterium]|jgi:glutamate transport system permease protein|nr:amino acid ABC transporter permease [Jatrophihabitantaceae bacterium]
MEIVLSHLGILFSGFGATLELSVIGFVAGGVLGTLLAVCRVVPVAPLRVFGSVYVEVFRNIPLVALLTLVVFGLPDAGVTYSLFDSAALCLTLVAAAYVCEAVRGGINAVPVGQAEAARAIGLSLGQSLRAVILPQALRCMVQPLVNVFIGVALSSSLAAAVGVGELTDHTEQLNLRYAQAIPAFLVAGLLYLAITLSGAAAGARLERRLTVRR